MNAEQIRAQYVEVLARAEFEENHRAEIKTQAWEWGNVAEGMRAMYRRSATRAVDALAAAGLLPVEAVRRDRVDLTTGDEYLVQQYRTDWRAVES
ncbi:hypothetical protein [Nocardia flavorosea]|uniref:Uncharacterized protein n=1 Tax=Nocardia flavorosea TaxID=53429 RepID=A0A846YL87_9NOCA|nr:hypothetical protein [Nocardia flavorosea]NKY60406.1 hypothetical protein [Nocardia flavorosea]